MTSGDKRTVTRRRRTPLIGALIVACAALAVLGARGLVATSDEERSRANPPNFVVVMTDDQALRDMDVMTETNRLVGEHGVTFANSFATFPLCCPSRASFLTGQHPHNHGVLGNRPPDGGFAGFDDRGTLAVALRRAGYATGLFGKYFNGYGRFARENPQFVPRGWGRWHSIADRGYFGYTLIENGELRDYGHRTRDYLTDVFTRKVTGFIGRASDRDVPFFAFVPTYAAHTERAAWGRQDPNPRPAPRHADALADREFAKPPNYNPADVETRPSIVSDMDRLGPRRERKMSSHDRHRARSLLAVDDMVREIVRQLRESDALAHTYIIFTSDHGFAHGEHRRRGKQDLYEESARVPLLIRGPGLPEGETIDAIAANIDLAPTILGAAGVEPLRTPDGIDLRPVVDEPEAYRGRGILLANEYATGIRTLEHMYAEHEVRGQTEYELYDMAADPNQLRNLLDPDGGEPRAPSLDREVARLRERLDELRDCAGTSGPGSCD